ncbi:MAG TPA: peptidyl-prolyl cis-trans isomerase [Candidatus Polarisedimenticolia bacterium]|nr:peptidyl-prolyl cis-trans isomerase [Candidatus Polarisedimenticolia bacterium]
MIWRRNGSSTDPGRTAVFASVLVAAIVTAHAADPAAPTPPKAGSQAKPPAAGAPARTPAAGAPAKPSTASESKPDSPVAKVNGSPLTRRDYDLTVQVLFRKRGLGQRSHADLESVRKAALDLLIDNELLYQKAKEAGITVTDAEAKEEAARLKKALGSPDDVAAFLKDIGATDADLTAQVRRTLSVNRFVDQKVVPGLAVDDAQARAWYDSHPDAMRRPEAAHIRQIVIAVPPDAPPATRTAARQKIEEVMKALRGGEDFAVLAKRHSDGPEAQRGGDSGYVSAGGGALPVIERAALSLKPGQTSDILETRRGFHIVQVIDRRPGGAVPFEEAKPRIVERLKDEQRQAKVRDYVATLRSGARIEKLA